VPLAIAFVGGFALLVLRGRNGRWPLPPMVVLVTFALGVGVWWQSSPVSRFGVVPCWVLAAWVSTAWLQRLSTAKVQWVVASPVVLAFLCASVMSVENPTPRALVRGFVGGFTRDIRTKGWVDTSLRTTGFETYVTDSGARLNVIRTESGLCWDTPIPCTSTPSKNLELRDPTNLGRGFRIRGDWNPENWPTPALTSFRSTAR